ncbi:hypothetical protein IJT17_01200 [bacterium]|nr:hypothetical protein [bacterium]
MSYGAGREYEARMRLENEIRLMGKMVEQAASGSASDAAEEIDSQIIQLPQDMWPPLFVSGAKCKLSSHKFENIPRGSFIIVRYRGHIHVVRMLSWKFVDNKIALTFIPGPKDHRAITTSELELLGLVHEVANPLSGEVANPNRSSIFAYIWNNITNYGTKVWWRGLYNLIDTFIIDASTRSKQVQKQELSFWDGLKLVRAWTKDEEKRKQQEALEKKRSKKWRRAGDDLEYHDNETIEEDSYDEAKRKLAGLTDQDLDKWWIDVERAPDKE